MHLEKCEVEVRIIISKDEGLKFILKGISAEAKRYYKIFPAGLIVNNCKTVIKSDPGFRWRAAPKVEHFIKLREIK